MTIRSFSARPDRVKDGAVRMISDIAEAHGLRSRPNTRTGTRSRSAISPRPAFAEHTVAALFGRERFDPLKYPRTGAEDFSFVLERLPGRSCSSAPARRTGPPATAPFNHSAEAVFDDAVLSDGAALYAELALRRLAAS